ncbi:homoserine dehydrogenase [Moraxella caviae]|uniref:Homoserine dehydrogenase n=1 Tax=Moraxella caviae TaxID=34060 RepID=A0A1S9ZVM6_9GAMM|nr:homoserine dehydrogenase [Moraxella caviae]OOR87534.1 homoserine dehydrogenase [Moraxella caviae]STZ10067.1 Homoserine dehydrogenase [Moraxella caviae]VEW12742.1 Homoserine dehydrogenase [Moraxella caviae]
MSKSINLAVLGLGTVGTGVVHLLNDNARELARRSGYEIKITHVGTRRDRSDIDPAIKQSADLMAIAEADDVDIVIEVIGGTTVAKDVILHAIRHKKHVVTANKALLAKHGNEIFALAEEYGVQVRYEAAVAGGIPIIKIIREALAANKIDWLAGIINGTGNFIMSEMQQKNRKFGDVLAEAQALGYAEANPTFDVEGIDAAHKLALLASIAFGIPIQFDKVYCEGITKVSLQDVVYAKELGYNIKHLGFAFRRENGFELRVHPTLIPDSKLLANVNGVKNAVMVDAHPLGQSLYYGDGAGAGATASAVMADVMDLIYVIAAATPSDVPHLAFVPEALSDTRILTSDEMQSGYYLRLTVKDELGVLADTTRILSENGINIDAIMQRDAHKSGLAPVIILTLPVIEKQMNAAIKQIETLSAVAEPVVRIRLESLDE